MRRKLVNRKVVNSIGIGILAAMTAATPVMAQAQELVESNPNGLDAADVDTDDSTNFKSESDSKLEQAAGAIEAAQDGVKDNEGIQEDLDNTETNVGELKEKVEAFDKANGVAGDALSTLESAVTDDEKNTLETMKENVSEAKKEIAELDDSTQSNVAEAEKQADAAQNLQGQEYADSAAAEAARNQAQTAADAAEAEYNSALDADAKAQEALDNAQASLGVLNDQKEKADQAKAAAEKAVEKAQEALDALLAEYKAEDGSYAGNSAQAIEAAQDALAKARADLGKAEGDIIDIAREIAEREEQVREAEQNKAEAERKLEDAKAGKEEADGIVTNKDNSLKEVEEKIENARKESEAADQAAQDARKEMKDTAIAAIADAQDKYKEEKKALEAVTEKAESAQKDLDNAQEALDKAGGENWKEMDKTQQMLEAAQEMSSPASKDITKTALIDYALKKEGKSEEAICPPEKGSSCSWVTYYDENGELKGNYFDFKEVDDKIEISQMETIFQSDDGKTLTLGTIGTGGDKLYAFIDGKLQTNVEIIEYPAVGRNIPSYRVGGVTFNAKPKSDSAVPYYSEKDFEKEYAEASGERNAAEEALKKAEEARDQADREKEEQQKKCDKASDYMNALTGAANFIMNQKGDENAEVIEELIEAVYRAGGTAPKSILDDIIAKKQDADQAQADADAKKEILGLTETEREALVQKIEAAEELIKQYLELEADYSSKREEYNNRQGALTKAQNYSFVETAHNKVVEAINSLENLKVQSMDEKAYAELMDRIGEAVQNYDAALKLKDSIEAKVEAALQAFNRAKAAATANFNYRQPVIDSSSAAGTTDNEEEGTTTTGDTADETGATADTVVIPLATTPTGIVTAIPDAQIPTAATVLAAEADASNTGTVTTLARGGAGNGVVQAGAGEEELTADGEEEDVVTVADEEVPLASVDLEAGEGDSLTVADEEVPLTNLVVEQEKNKMSWWWLLIVAVCGATGYEMYRRHKKNQEQEEM